MSGILDKKQRLIDFILTSDGYKQIENGDLRFVYATLTDNEAIYDLKQGEYNVADLNAMPFFFEANSSFFDKLNAEIDLRQSANFELRTEIDGQYIDLRNNEYQNTLVKPITTIFDKIATSLTDNLVNQNIILTDNAFNLDYVTQRNHEISLYVSKINDSSISLTNTINNNNDFTIKLNSISNITDYFTLVNENSLNLSKTSMLEDDRFQNKLNYLFLPPANMNLDVITKNNKIANSYNLAQDLRKKHKIIFKNLKSTKDIMSEELKNFKDFTGSSDEAILEAIKLLENPELQIANVEFTFENQEFDSEFILNLVELNTSNNGSIFNKLLFVNHGEIFDKIKQKNVQVYSVGKLYSSKTEIDLDNNFDNNLKNGEYIIEDNYLFTTLFTIIVE
jgi:hypothetical protein